MSNRISKPLRQAIEHRARRRCEYCLCPLDISTDPFAVEHVFSTIRGGKTSLENLALSCSGCNGHKYDKQHGYDSISEQSVPLYHPRFYDWSDNFAWSEDYMLIIGLSPVGRVTIKTLRLNRPAVVNLRGVLFLAGMHPPEDL